MSLLLKFLFFVFFIEKIYSGFPGAQPDDGDYRHLYPKVCLGIRINKHEHILPYSMGLIENLKYPKDRIHVAFVAEESSDQETLGSAKYWSAQNSKLYLSTAVLENRKNTREEALQWARMKNCDFAFITIPDDLLMANILKKLIDLKFIVVSPLLNGPFGSHSNVHGLLDSGFVDRIKVGSQQVYYFNGPYMINLKEIDSSYLTFDAENVRSYNGPNNPIQVFAYSAYSMKIPIFVDNREFYGYILDSTFYSINHHRRLLGYFLANLISDNGPMPFPHSTALEPWYPIPSQFGFDQIYVINLKRRPERLQKMDLIMRLLGIDYRVFEAVDGPSLTPEQLSYIQFLPGYEDPYYKRPMKKGEIGCFLSHYGIWNHVVQKGYERVIIFEDDVRFAENSTVELAAVLEDIIKTRLDWDLIYLGRKKMTAHGDEFFVPGHRYLSTLAYSYWTLGYALSQTGAQKLLAAKPLGKMLALDEFLPIMYDKHPNKEWSSYFPERNLKAFAVYPVIVTPEKYTHDAGYVSDTEASGVVDFSQKENQSSIYRESDKNLGNNVHASSTVMKNEL